MKARILKRAASFSSEEVEEIEEEEGGVGMPSDEVEVEEDGEEEEDGWKEEYGVEEAVVEGAT